MDGPYFEGVSPSRGMGSKGFGARSSTAHQELALPAMFAECCAKSSSHGAQYVVSEPSSNCAAAIAHDRVGYLETGALFVAVDDNAQNFCRHLIISAEDKILIVLDPSYALFSHRHRRRLRRAFAK